MMSLPDRFGPQIGKPKDLAQAKMPARNNEMKFAVRLAEIIRIDYVAMVCDLAYVQGDSPPAEEVPLSAALWGKRQFLGGVPEVGSLVVVGYSASYQNKHTRPFILAFVPHGIKTAFDYDPFGPLPRNPEEGIDLSTDQLLQELEGLYGATRYKMRPLFPGDILGMSAQGAELLLDEGVSLSNRSLDRLELRDYDNALIQTSVDSYIANASGQIIQGRIVRNALNIDLEHLTDGKVSTTHPNFGQWQRKGLIYNDGSLVPDVNRLSSLTLENGSRFSLISKNTDNDVVNTSWLTESRQDIYETYDSKGISNEGEDSGRDRVPFITRVLGTLVGHDSVTAQGRAQYGKVLKFHLFDTPYSTQSNYSLQTVDRSDSLQAIAAYYRFRTPQGSKDLVWGHDKEGHCYASIPASTSTDTTLGSGRSADINLDGSLKTTLGSNALDNESWRLDGKGGMRWTLGPMHKSGRAQEVITTGGVFLQVRQPDLASNARKIELVGNDQLVVEGSQSSVISGDRLDSVTGAIETTAESCSLQVGAGNYNVTVLSDHALNVTGSEVSIIGQGVERTIVKGGKSTEIVSGDSQLRFGASATRSVSFASSGTHTIQSAGSLSINRRSGGSANYAFEAPSGSYAVRLATGTISLTAGSGIVTIDPSAIRMTSASISLTGSVSLGSAAAPNAVVGGVPGPSPHIDYLTGLPLTGNPLVRTL